jgi:NADPH:quinone reductase-like Zn-dependent oxidoreductase
MGGAGRNVSYNRLDDSQWRGTIMKALQVGDGEGLARLSLVERPDPTPGHGEVVVRMRAVSLNYRDLAGLIYPAPSPRPFTPFSDGCGIVEAVGPGVTRVEPGDRVSTLFFEHWVGGGPSVEKAGSALGGGRPRGAGAERIVLSQDGVSKVPDYLDDRQVACLPCAALTAWRALFVDARLEPGDTVVLQGTGGVSIFGLQLAKAAGYRTIITSSSDEKLERARELGADHTVNYKAKPEWSKAVREHTDGRGADFIMEVGGAGTLDESLKSVRLGGHIAVIGILSGFSPPLQIGMMIGTSARLQGVSVGSRDMFEAMCRALELHRIKPVVDLTFAWTDARSAFAAMQAGEHFGKIVLDFAV